MTMDIITVIFILVFAGGHITSGQTLAQSKTLMSDMLTGYDKRHRPVLDQSQSINVTVSFDIVAIQDFDEVEEKFSAVGVMNLSWVDESISWNPFSYGGIWSQMYRLQDVWYPILVLANPYNSVTDIGDDWMTVRILYNGEAYFTPGAVFTSTCSVDVTYYPFDTQSCDLLIIPWGFLNNEMKLISNRDDILQTFYSENGEWSLESTRAVQSTIGGYDSITFTFKIRRKPLFMVVNVILPIIFMAVINLLVFFLPVESGERVSYAITVLLALAVFLTLVGDNLPKTSEPISVLCYFLMIILVISTLMCVVTIFNLRVYHSKCEKVPRWCKSFTQLTKCRTYWKKIKCKNRSQVDGEALETGISIIDSKKTNGQQDKSTRVTAFASDEDTVVKEVEWKDVSAAIDRVSIIFFSLALIISVSVYLSTLINNRPP